MLLLLALGEAILLVTSMSILDHVSEGSFDNSTAVQNTNGQSQQSLSIIDPVITSRTLNPVMLSKSTVDKDNFVFGESTKTDDTDNRNQYRRNVVNTTCEDNQVFFQSQCHVLLKQGPCRPDQWLVEMNGQGECKNSGCHYPQIPYDGKCLDDNQLRYDQFQQCPAGMTLSPSKDGTISCDCRAGYLYNSEDDKCYKAYTKGPCPRYGDYFILPRDAKVKQEEIIAPKCVKNPCKFIDYVCLGGSCPSAINIQRDCVKLGNYCMNDTGRYEIDLETEQLEIACISLDKLLRRTIANVPSFACSKGSKRDVNGVCRKTTSFTFS
jgi:hypothetical protein